MAQSHIRVDVDIEKFRQVAEAFQWFAGRLSAAADELYEALDAPRQEPDYEAAHQMYLNGPWGDDDPDHESQWPLREYTKAIVDAALGEKV